MDFKPFKIGKYLLLERLATGGMAEVYRAKASGAGGFEKQLAIKRILPSYSENEEFQRMFEYEARLSSMLTHANIVQVYDFVKSGETYLLALEYVDGKNLRQFVNKNRKVGYVPPIEFSVYVINEVCKGLEYAHRKKDDITGRPLNIIHRDMSPQNIMLSYDGAVKIVDFGIAKAKDRVDETRSGVIKGKFGYMSPEQANGQPVDHRTDIFSTAIILWELLTSKRLFAAENDMATLKLIQECVIPAPSRLNPKVTPDLEKIVLKGLTKDISLRFQSAGVFHRALQEFLNKNFGSFTQREAGEVLARTFKEEIENEKKRFEQIYRQSIPFSQGESKPEAASEFDDIEEALDGELTKSEAGSQSAVTFIDEMEKSSSGIKEISGSSVPNEKTSMSGDNIESTQVESVLGEGDESMPTQVGDEGRGDTFVSIKSVPGRSLSGEKTLLKDEQSMLSIGSTTRGRGNQEDDDDQKTSLTNSTSGTSTEGSVTDAGSNSVAGSKGSGLILRAGESNPRRRSRSSKENDEEQAQASSPSEQDFSNRYDSNLSPSSGSRDEQGLGMALEEFNRGDSGGQEQRPDYGERESYNQGWLKRRLTSSLLLLMTVGATAYLYRLYLDGSLQDVLRNMLSGQTTITDAPDKSLPPGGRRVTEEDPKSVGNCTLEVESDPAGASVFVNGKASGFTTTTVSAPCNRKLQLTIQMDGYEEVTEPVYIKDRMPHVYRTLKVIPTGRVEFYVDRNATVYIDGQIAGEAKPNEKFEKIIVANKKHVVRFVNEVYKVDIVREVTLQPDTVERLEIPLIEPLAPSKKK